MKLHVISSVAQLAKIQAEVYKLAGSDTWTSWGGSNAGTRSLTAQAKYDGMQVYCEVSNGSASTESDIVTMTVTDTFTVDDVTYKINNSTQVDVYSYSGSASSLTIPASVESFNVVKVGDSAFEGNTALTSIDLPDSITVIGKRAFANCTNLKSMS